MESRAAAGLLLALLTLALNARANVVSTSSSVSMDFLIQDVCIDEQTGAVNPQGDPATCAHHRDLRPGETLPYHKHAYDVDGPVLYQLCDAFPLPHSAGTVRVG